MSLKTCFYQRSRTNLVPMSSRSWNEIGTRSERDWNEIGTRSGTKNDMIGFHRITSLGRGGTVRGWLGQPRFSRGFRQVFARFSRGFREVFARFSRGFRFNKFLLINFCVLLGPPPTARGPSGTQKLVRTTTLTSPSDGRPTAVPVYRCTGVPVSRCPGRHQKVVLRGR